MEDKKENKNFIFKFLDDIVNIILSIFSYAILGLKVLTIIPLKKIFSQNKKIKYSPKKLIKLDKEYQELEKDLRTTGATRSKEINTYYYKVRDKNGQIKKGKMNGSSKLDINSFLINEGYTVYSIKTSPLINILNKDIGDSRLKSRDLVFFLTQLEAYLESGISLNDSIKILERQAKNKRQKKIYQSLSFELTLGSSFSHASEKLDKYFPSLLINMVTASEESGTLIETLKDLANYYKEVDDTHRQTTQALIYPAIVSVFAIGVIIFILTFIIPEFVETYNSNNMTLNPITTFIINISNYLETNILSFLTIILVGVLLFIFLYKKVQSFRKFIQKTLMHLPVIKNVIIYNELAIITKTFASLLKNRVYITDSVNILLKITNNEIYKEILENTIKNITKGEKISTAFKGHWAVPEVAYFMIMTGENTGELDDMMLRISKYYQNLHKDLVKNLKTFIEPILIAFLAIVVGGILIAVILPMFDMYEEMMK